MHLEYYSSPVGLLEITGDHGCIVGIYYREERDCEETPDDTTRACVGQLKEYFAGERTSFSLPIFFKGTPFRQRVWKELERIPYGETISYQELAERIGNPKAVRAVGGANHHNPISIVVPCHRVIGKDGSLTGYGGGTDKKQFLLTLEKRK